MGKLIPNGNLAGEYVRIKKGARVSSTHPNLRGVILTRRPYVVRVAYSSKSIPAVERLGIEASPAMVNWAGSGGYWKWCPLDDIEILEGNE